MDIGPLLATFEGDEHFLTYQGERNSSFSTNCNVLMCLVMLEDPLSYTSQIIKTVQFLNDRIFTAQIMDKWVRDDHSLYLVHTMHMTSLKTETDSKHAAPVSALFHDAFIPGS